MSLLPGDGHVQVRPSGVDITAASDSFVFVGDRLQEVVNWCSGLQVAGIRCRLLVRGSIAYGAHVQQNVHATGTSRHHTLIVSRALALAAADEKRKTPPPCGITLDGSVTSVDIRGLDDGPQLARQRAILFRDGRWIANPFDGAVLRWAKNNLEEMLAAHLGTPYQAKYEWMLDLFADVENNKPMRPEPDMSDALSRVSR